MEGPGHSTGEHPIDVIVADDHPVVIAGLAAMLSAEANGVRVVARCRDAEAAFEAIRTHRPAVAVVKLELQGALHLVRRVNRTQLACGVVLFGSAIGEDQALEAYRLGAKGLLLKTLPAPLIAECIRKVSRGERWIEQTSASGVMDRVARGAATDADGGLTARERQIASLAASGLRNREIADRLGLSVGTVKIHLHHVYRKLGVRGRVQLGAHTRKRTPR